MAVVEYLVIVLTFGTCGIGLLVEAAVLARRRHNDRGSLWPALLASGGALGLLVLVFGFVMTVGIGNTT